VRAADCSGGNIEEAERSVANHLHDAAGRVGDVLSEQLLMTVEEIAASAVTDRAGQLRRAHDVGEQHGRQDRCVRRTVGPPVTIRSTASMNGDMKPSMPSFALASGCQSNSPPDIRSATCSGIARGWKLPSRAKTGARRKHCRGRVPRARREQDCALDARGVHDCC
jgi:hypothetical protein